MKKFYSNAGLLLISIVFSLLLGEFIVRKANLSKTWESYLDGELILDLKTVYGDKIGYRRRPGITFNSARGAVYVINDLGFREKKISQQNKGKIRLAFLGDSVTEGFGVSIDDRYTSLVEKSLIAQKHPVETINFAVAGHSTSDQLAVFRKFLIQFHPDYLFLQMCYNDFDKNYGDANPQLQFTAKPPEKKPFTLIGFLQAHSAFYLFLAERYNYQKLSSDIPNSLLPTSGSVTADQWKFTVSFLDEIQKLCLDNNIQLLISYVPLEVEVVIKDEQKGNLVNNKIKSYCTSRKIEFLDLVTPLRNYNKGPRQQLYLDDCHLTSSGNSLIAGIIASVYNEKLRKPG